MKPRRVHVLFALFFSMLVLPSIPSPGSAPDVRPEWLMVVLACMAFPIKRTLDSVSLCFLFVSFAMCVSMGLGELALGTTVSGKDTFELLKPALYGAFYAFARSTQLSEADLRWLLRAVLSTFCLVAVIAVIQFFDHSQRLAPLLALYTDKDLEIYLQTRTTSTMGNPNSLGILFVFGSALSLFFLDHRLLYGRLDFAALALLVANVFMTGSRTAFLGLVAVGLTYVAVSLHRRRIKRVLLIGLLVAGPLAAVLTSDQFALSMERYFLWGRDDAMTHSWNQRVAGALDVMPTIDRSPLFGWGPNKDGFEIGTDIDNEFVLVMYRYGAVGIFVFVALYYLMWRSTQAARSDDRPLLRSYAGFATGLMPGAVVAAYGAGLFHIFRIMTLLTLFLAVGTSIAHELTSSGKEARS